MSNKINSLDYVESVVSQRLRLNRQPDTSEMNIKLFSGIEVNAIIVELLRQMQPTINELGRVKSKRKGDGSAHRE